MTNIRRKIAVFDFDGTLTTRDTLPLFIRHAAGIPRLLIGFTALLPLILLMKLHLYDNGRCKERLFSWFFKGMPYNDFAALGQSFCHTLPAVARQKTHQALAQHREQGADIYIVSASIDEWVRPYCERLGVKDVLATKVEVDDSGRLTGRFATPNCYGEEKIRRLLAVEPDRSAYHLTAYGDSSGDTEMFALADEYFKIK